MSSIKTQGPLNRSRRHNELSGFLSELEAIHFFESRGFIEHFSVEEEALVDLRKPNGSTYSPEECTVREVARFEGISDVDDMVVVYAIETDSGSKGLLIDAFGPNSSPKVGAFLERVEMQHHEVMREDLPAQVEQKTL